MSVSSRPTQSRLREAPCSLAKFENVTKLILLLCQDVCRGLAGHGEWVDLHDEMLLLCPCGGLDTEVIALSAAMASSKSRV